MGYAFFVKMGILPLTLLFWLVNVEITLVHRREPYYTRMIYFKPMLTSQAGGTEMTENGNGISG